MNTALNIGTSEEAVKASKEAILEIMNQKADQLTIQIAIKVFVESIQPKDIVISNCNFVNNEKEDKKVASRAKIIGEKLKKSRERGGE